MPGVREPGSGRMPLSSNRLLSEEKQLVRAAASEAPKQPLLDELDKSDSLEKGGVVENAPYGQVLAYAQLRCPIMMADALYGPLFTVYTEVYGLSLESMMVARILAKSIDLILSFVVGHISDNLKTPFGRRKPFIALAPPLAAFGLLMLASPPSAFTAGGLAAGKAGSVNIGPIYDPCGAVISDGLRTARQLFTANTTGRMLGEADFADLSNSRCPEVQMCVLESIKSGELPRWSANPTSVTGDVTGQKVLVPDLVGVVSNSPTLVLWFLIFFMMRFTLGNTVVAIPYDALGQELARTPQTQRTLFVTKTFFAMCARARTRR